MPPTLAVLLYASLAAFAAGLGAVPLLVRSPLPPPWIGWANAVASGLMLGVAYALMTAGGAADGAGAAGALLGIAFVAGTHAATGTGDLDLNRIGETSADYGYKVLLVNTLHAAHEGIAIGAAMAVSLPFGISMALAIGAHNLPEGAILGAILTSRGVRVRDAAALAVAANVNQVLLAVVTFAVVGAAPALLVWARGFAVGALIYLVMVELLPESYRQAGRTGIALVAVVAMGVVVLLSGAGA